MPTRDWTKSWTLVVLSVILAIVSWMAYLFGNEDKSEIIFVVGPVILTVWAGVFVFRFFRRPPHIN